MIIRVRRNEIVCITGNEVTDKLARDAATEEANMPEERVTVQPQNRTLERPAESPSFQDSSKMGD